MPVPPWFGRNRRLHYYHYLWLPCTILLLQEQWFHLQTPYASASFTLSLTGGTSVRTNYQWQSSPDGVSFTNIPGQHLPLTMLYKQILLIIAVLLPAASAQIPLFCKWPWIPFLCYCDTCFIGPHITDNINTVQIISATLNNPNTGLYQRQRQSYTVYPATGNTTAVLSTGGSCTFSVTSAACCYFCGLTTIVWVVWSIRMDNELPPSHTRYSGNRQHYHSI